MAPHLSLKLAENSVCFRQQSRLLNIDIEYTFAHAASTAAPCGNMAAVTWSWPFTSELMLDVASELKTTL
jgi:hypothetical protein